MDRAFLAPTLVFAACVIPSTPIDSIGTSADSEDGSATATSSESITTTISGTESGDTSSEEESTAAAESSASSGSDEDSTSTSGGDPPPPRTIFVEKDYETEIADDVASEAIGTMTYRVGSGYDGSNCWELQLHDDTVPEEHAGWSTSNDPPAAPIPPGATDVMFVGYMLYVSSGLIDAMVASDLGGKMMDAHMYEDRSDPETRQITYWGADNSTGAVVPGLVKGGAGGWFTEQLLPVAFDLRDYADQWIWVGHEFDAAARTTTLWVATPDGAFSGAYDEPLVRRSADDDAHWHVAGFDEDPYDYSDGGWERAGLLWGYWQAVGDAPLGPDDIVRLDDLVVADGWLGPPASL